MLQNQQYDIFITEAFYVNAEPKKNAYMCIFKTERVKLGHLNSKS